MKKTNNYDIFKISEANRKIIPSQIKNIKESIKEVGYLEYNPVVVDKKFNIIDGQHRYYACKELGLPILYVIEKGDISKIMVKLNANQKTWGLNDFIDHYASKGIEWYVYFNYFKEKYNLNQTSTLAILTNNDGQVCRNIKLGKGFDINSNQDDIAEIINEFRQSLDFALSKCFIRSIVRLYNKGSGKDIKKLLDNKLIIKKQVNIADYYIVFENILNKGRSNKNYISL